MIINYFWGAFPSTSIFGLLPLTTWSFIHAISAMIFAGTIITTAFLEAKIWDNNNSENDNNDNENDQTKLRTIQKLFPMERNIVLPALSMNILSGVAQVYGTYVPTSLKYAPPHIKSVFNAGNTIFRSIGNNF